MAEVAIAPYVSEGIDAGYELESLGIDEAEYFLLYLQKQATRQGTRSYWRGPAFRGRSVRRKDHGGCFIIYVVETERDRSVRVTLIYAGQAAAFADQPAVNAFVAPRLKDYFK